MFRFLSICLSLILLAGCGSTPQVPENPDELVEGDSPLLALRDAVHYETYSADVVGQGKPVILFFHKSSDPFSVRSDKVLTKLYGTGGSVVSTYKVDFSTSTGARLKYSVLVEDTFVLIDAKGSRVDAFIHPSAEEIGILLRGKVPVPPKK